MRFRPRLRARISVLAVTAALILAALFSVLTLFTPAATSAADQTIPYLINFQGRLTDNNGNILPDGSYNIKFRIFNAATGGTNEWEADRVYGASDDRVTVENGLFNIQFGDTSQGDPALSPSLFSGAYPLYLEVELPTPATATCASNGCAVWTEGAMTPRQALASSPYAFNADTLDGLDSTAFGQLAAANAFTGANSFSNTNTFNESGGAGIVLSGAPASAGSILQIGSVLSSGNTNGTLIGANGSFTGDLVNLQVGNTTEFKVDNSGNLSLASGAAISIGSAAGSGTTCSGGQFLQNQVVTGGITTGGTCATPSGTGANQQLSNLSGTVAVNLSLVPQTTNSINLGSSSIVYSSAFVRNLTFDGTAAAAINFTGAASGAGNTLAITGQAAGGTSQTGGNITITAGTGSSTAGTGGTLTLDGGGAPTGGTDGPVTLDAGSGATTANGTISIGTANASVINVGNSTVATTLSLGGGTGANVITMGNSQTGGSLSLGAAMTTGTITIGGAVAQTGAIILGQSTGTNTVRIGDGTGATTVQIATGVTNAKTVQIGTGAAMANTINIGGTGANVIAMGNTQTAGSVSIGAAMTTGTITLGGAVAQTGAIIVGQSTGTNTVRIGDGTGATTIQIGTGVTNAKTIQIGTGAAMANTINVGGTGANVIAIGNTQTAGSISLGSAMTTGTVTIGGAVAQTGAIILGQSTGTNTVRIGDGTGATTVQIATGVTNAKTVQIGTGAAMANTINVGGTGANVIAIGNTQTAGSVAIGSALTTGTISIGDAAANTTTTTIQGGNTSTGNGAVSIQAASSGLITIGTTNANPISLGGNTTVSGGKNLILASGSGSFQQTFTNTVASNAQTLAFTNNNSGAAGVTIQGINITPTNTNPTSGTNTLNAINFAAGSGTSATAVTNGINFASGTGYTNYLTTPTTTLDSSGDVTSTFTQLTGTSTTNGTGSSSTSLVLNSATNFVVGNYVQINSANCGGTGINPCYAKITAIVSNTLTITPALTWANGATVNQYHIPELGGIDTSQTLANRYGRGYFIAGVATGNGTTYYDEDGITSSLSTYNLLSSSTDAVATLNIGNTSTTNLTLGGAGTTVAVPGALTVAGQSVVNSSGQINGAQLQSGTVANGALANSSFGTSLTGLTGSASVALGGTLTLATAYGSGTNTAVQGNVQLVCPTTSGNLSGSGNTITLGSGGNCGAISFTNTPSFSGQLTLSGNGAASTPILDLTGTPTANATTSLVQLAGAIASGNTNTNGGTYLGINLAGSGAGSAADFLNFQKAGSVEFKVDNSGNGTLGGGLTIGSGAAVTVGSSAGQTSAVSCSANQAVTAAVFTGGVLTTAPTCSAITGTGANTTLSNLGTTSINASLAPATNNNLSVGSAADVWQNVYTGNIDAGTTTTTLSVGTASTTTGVTIGRATVAVSLPGGISTSGGNVSAGSGTVTAATVNATTGFSANGTAAVGASCSGGQVNEGATYTEGILTTGGTCTSVQAAGNYIIQAPTGTANTITAASGAQALTIKGTNGTSTHLLDIYNTAASPVLTSYFDQNGAFTTTAAITAPTTGSINSLNINAGALSGVTGITQGSGSDSITSNSTTTDAADLTDTSFATAASGSASLLNGAFTAGSSNATGTATTNGLLVNPTINASGAGAKAINGVNLVAPTVTACTSGTCTLDGLQVNTITSGAASNITSQGLDVEATGISAGKLTGLNISAITGGGGTETAVSVGTGWDNILTYNNGATVIINGSGQLNGAQLQSASVANGSLANSTLGVTAGTGLTGGSNSIALGTSTSLSIDQTASLTWTGAEAFNKSGGVGAQFNGSAASAGAQLLFGSVTGLNGGSTSGTYIGANPASYAGDFVNFAINGVNKLKVDNSGDLTAAGTITAPTVNATTGFSANGTAGTGVTCGAGTVNEAATYTEGILTTAGTCTSVQAAGNYLVQGPASTAADTITPTGSTTGLTVNGSSTATLAVNILQGQAADGEDIALSATGTNTNGLLVSRAAAGTTTSALAVTNATGTTTNGLSIAQTSGTVTNGIAFSGTIGTDINRATGILTLNGGGGVTVTSGAATNISLTPGTTGLVTVGGNTPTLSGNTTLTLQSASGNNINITPGTTGVVVVGGNTPTITTSGATALKVDTGGGAQLSLGTTNATTVTIGNTTAATTTNLIGGTAANAINFAPATNGGIFGATTGTGVVEFDSGAGIVEQSTTNNTQAFQIQNSGGVSMLNIDTSTGAANNLLSNSGFERNPMTDWVGLAAGGSITRVTTQAFSDFASGEVVTSTAAGGGFDEPVTLATSTQYTFSFYAKADSSTPNITDLRAGYSSTGINTGEVNCTLTSTTIITTGWNRYTCTFTTPATESGTPYIYIGHTTTTSDTFYVDAAQLETGSFASPYGQGQLTLNATINSPVNFQETANSLNAFQITNTIGTNILNVDTYDNNQNNQVIDPSFETGLTGWTARTGCTLSQDNTTAYNGTSSGLCTISSATAKAGFELLSSTGLSPALVANTTYTVALYVKSSVYMTTLEIGHDDITGTDIPCITAQAASPLGWRRYTCTFTTGATLTSPFIYVMQTDAAIRNIWIDAVTLETDANASSNYRDGRISLGNATISSPAVFQTLTNSSTAFQVQNAAGIQVFDIDTASDPDLVTNSGFEVNSVGWTAINGATGLIRDTTKSYVGIASGKVTTTTTANSGMRYTFSTQQPAVAATAYTISAYVETSVADATFTLGYNNGSTDTDCTTTPTPSATVPSTAGWTRFTCSTPVNTAVSSIFVSSGTTAVTLNVDGVDMVLGSTALAFGNSNITFNGVFTSPIDIRNPSNNTTEFQVQDASSNTLFGIDSLNDTINTGATGSTALASTVNIATSTGAAQTVNLGSTNGTGTVNVSSGSGGINIGDDTGTEEVDIGGVTATGVHVVKIGTNTSDTGAISIGNNGTATTVAIDAGTGAAAIAIGNSNTAHNISIGNGGAAAGNAQSILIGSDTTTTASKIILDAGNDATSSGTTGVIIGSATADANQVNLQLDSSSTFTETASTCSTTINQGALYYNTASQSIRTCDVAGSWDDVLTAQGLGLMLFGILSDSGTAPGDLASLETAAVSGPCKVSWNSATTINISACTAYSGGRKVVVAAQSAVAITTTTTNRWENVCLTGTGNQPAFVGPGASQTAAGITPTFSLTAPILCLATLEQGTATSGSFATGGEIFDTRTFIETTKEAVTDPTTADPIGDLAQASGAGIGPSTATAGTGGQEGVVVASNDTTSATTPEAIIATNGPAWVNAVLATTSTAGDDVEASATAGFAEAANVTFATANFEFLGISRVGFTANSACTSAVLCQESLFLQIGGGP